MPPSRRHVNKYANTDRGTHYASDPRLVSDGAVAVEFDNRRISSEGDAATPRNLVSCIPLHYLLHFGKDYQHIHLWATDHIIALDHGTKWKAKETKYKINKILPNLRIQYCGVICCLNKPYLDNIKLLCVVAFFLREHICWELNSSSRLTGTSPGLATVSKYRPVKGSLEINVLLSKLNI
jgi:hypothetical protein